MSWTQDIRRAVSAWRKHAEGLNTLRRMAEQRPATAAFAFDLAAEELQQRALLDLYYFGVLSPQARYTQQLERIEDHATEARKEALFYETSRVRARDSPKQRRLGDLFLPQMDDFFSESLCFDNRKEGEGGAPTSRSPILRRAKRRAGAQRS